MDQTIRIVRPEDDEGQLHPKPADTSFDGHSPHTEGHIYGEWTLASALATLGIGV
jgi:hypothetical protein